MLHLHLVQTQIVSLYDFMGTINCISYFMSPVEKKVKEKLIPALFDGFPISEEFRKLLALPCKLGRIGIIDPT